MTFEFTNKQDNQPVITQTTKSYLGSGDCQAQGRLAFTTSAARLSRYAPGSLADRWWLEGYDLASADQT